MGFGIAAVTRVWGSSHLFPAAYLMLTQATTALLIFVGLLGQSELAADIGLVQGATLATFFAFSGNARNLILTTRAHVPLSAIVGARLALLAPLSIAAILFCVGVTHVAAAIALILVARRALEWIAELELSERELAGDVSAAQRGMVLQGTLLLATALTIAAVPHYTPWAMLPWALSPALMITRRFVALGANPGGLRGATQIFPHFGSTAVTGLSIYIFRAMLVLIAGKALAGDLFVAFAIASLAGTLFANVLGPSISLYEQRTGKAYFPAAILSVTLSCVGVGALLIGATLAVPELLQLSGKGLLFWRALGWSLLGSAAMLLAQRVRLRLIGAAKDSEVFGAEVAMNVCLIAAIPLFDVLNAQAGLTALYLVNAVLLLVFYLAAERGLAERVAPASAAKVAAIFGFCVFFPLFLQLTGNVFDSSQPVWDSGGVLRTLPIPISVIACFLGLVLLGRFGAAGPSLWTILGLLVTMLLSTVVLATAPEAGERAKFLLILQYLLPAFGLVLGAMVAFANGALRAALVAVALIVPVQLASSWLEGNFALSHTLYIFSVYQHHQYVPVILAAALFVVLPGTWQAAGRAGRITLAALSALVAMYVAAASSIVAMLAVIAGVALFAVRQLLRVRPARAALAASAMSLAVLGGYNYLLSDTYVWWQKFGSFAGSKFNVAPVVTWHHDSARRHFSEWHINSDDGPGTWLLQFRPVQQSAVLTIKGEIMRGGIGLVSFEDRNLSIPRIVADRAGPIQLEIAVLPDRGNVILYQYGASAEARLRAQWQISSSADTESAPVGSESTLKEKEERQQKERQKEDMQKEERQASPNSPPEQSRIGQTQPKMTNLAERIGDWKLFGKGVIESSQAFFFGHDKPIPREIRTSAHNFYIDFAYNFGILALVPLLALMSYTTMLLWRHRREVLADDALFMHAAMVVFLLLVECNLKVTLRQPYPGIAIYFLWGFLLARLQSLESSRPDQRV